MSSKNELEHIFNTKFFNTTRVKKFRVTRDLLALFFLTRLFSHELFLENFREEKIKFCSIFFYKSEK